MERTKVTSWAFLKEMFGPDEKIGIMAYEAKGQTHKSTVKPAQMVKTCDEALSQEFTKRLQYLNARGLNIVVGINPLVDSATTRNKDSVKEIRHLIADIDTRKDDVTGKVVTGKERLDAMLADAACPKPYFILNTSPENYQAVWRVTGFTREQAESTQRNLGAYYGGDRNISTDISRGVRLPGLHNKSTMRHFQLNASMGLRLSIGLRVFRTSRSRRLSLVASPLLPLHRSWPRPSRRSIPLIVLGAMLRLPHSHTATPARIPPALGAIGHIATVRLQLL